MTNVETGELRNLVNWYVSDWGPVDWAPVKERGFIGHNPELAEMLQALSLIEADSQTMRRKLAATGADKSDELLEFIAVWLAEGLRVMQHYLDEHDLSYDTEVKVLA